MKKNSIIIHVFILMLGCQAVWAMPPSSDGNDLKDKRVAGHRVLKMHDGVDIGVWLTPNVIFEDRAEMFWVGTYGGVKVYDEKRDMWTNFTKQTEKTAIGRVEFISQSSDDRLWFVSDYSGGGVGSNLNCFDGKLWQKPQTNPKDSILSRPVTAMFRGRDGRLWFAVKDELVAYDGRQWSPRLNLSEAVGDDLSVKVKAGLQDSEGYIWLATSVGIVRFDEGKREWRTLDPIEGGATPEDKPKPSIYVRMMLSDGVYQIYEDRKGRIWFATTAAPVTSHLVYEKSKDSWVYYNLGNRLPKGLTEPRDLGLTVMYQDKSGRMIFGTRLGLLSFTESENKWELFTPQNSSLPDASIRCIFEDRSGRIWIGTGKGIVVLEP